MTFRSFIITCLVALTVTGASKLLVHNPALMSHSKIMAELTTLADWSCDESIDLYGGCQEYEELKNPSPRTSSEVYATCIGCMETAYPPGLKLLFVRLWMNPIEEFLLDRNLSRMERLRREILERNFTPDDEQKVIFAVHGVTFSESWNPTSS